MKAKANAGEAADAAVQSYLDLAEGVYQLGRIEEAAELLERAAEAAHEFGDDDPHVADVLNRLGVVRSRQGRHSEAERLLKRAAGICERAMTDCGARLATVLANLGAVCRAAGKTAQARAYFERALREAEIGFGPSDIRVAWTLDQIGDLEAALGDLPAAVFALRRSLAIKEQTRGCDSWDLAVTLNKLGELYLKNGRYNDAEAFFLRVVDVRERMLGWGDPAMARPLTRLGHLYSKQRKDGRAEQLVRYALKLYADVLPADHPEVIGCLNLLAEIFRGLCRYKDADAVWSLSQGLLAGTERREKIARFVLPNPPRMSGPPSSPAFEPGMAG